MNCPWGCDPAPCELCEAQAAQGLPTPRQSQAVVLIVAFIIIVVVCLVLA